MDYGAILILPGRLMEKKKKENFKQTSVPGRRFEPGTYSKISMCKRHSTKTFLFTEL